MRHTVNGIEIAGIASCLPVKDNTAPEDVCASDLCAGAAKPLIAKLDWDPEGIQLLVNVTQTPDSPNHPITAPYLANEIGLGEIMAIDVPGGAPGYLQGLFVASSLMNASAFDRALVTAGDALQRTLPDDCDPVAAQLGDAGTVTALVKNTVAAPMSFCFGVRGDAHDADMTPGLGYRSGFVPEALAIKPGPGGGVRRDVDPHIDPARLQDLARQEIPKVIEGVMDGAEAATVDVAFLSEFDETLHKDMANELGVMLGAGDLFAKHGNLASASLPAAMAAHFAASVPETAASALLAAFGAGFSVAAGRIDLPPTLAAATVGAPS